ncbi:hypothetical protein [Fodinicurvata sp. EGI_FJ10296]|uniref:hypothetical protein n=1 Tax=Fodinicurvata sp. EGI_FJ10296 TaxID=3231908 RepID=UPI0034543783
MARQRQGASVREYADAAGVSAAMVGKDKKAGRLVLHPDGSIDVEASLARRGATVNPAYEAGAAASPGSGFAGKQRRGQAAPPDHPPAAVVEAVGDALDPDAVRLPTIAGGEDAATAYLRAKTATELFKAKKAQLDYDQTCGTLVSRAAAEKLLFSVLRQHRDALVNLPARIAGPLAAELGVAEGPLVVALERVLHDHLESLADAEFDMG